MCGIAGFTGGGNRSDLENMIAAIKHRGPDDKGVFLVGDVGLAHARLSVIDLSERGHQPMFNDDKSVGVVFNGEIYNFKKLRERLVQSGHKFKSGTDTEAIIHLYEDVGEDCFKELEGMFAIGLYDFKQKKLILARDRMGKKPLYWAIFGGALMFASELKGLLKHSFFKKELDLESLNKYLLHEYVPTPQSIFKNTYKLEPATYLVYKNGEVKKTKFWNISYGGGKLNFSESLLLLGEKLEESVKARLVSDVPVGVFLSGGLDSSAVAYYAQKNYKGKIKTFSVGFEEKSFDESEYAQEVADFLGTEHYNFLIKARDALEIIPNIEEFIDEPIADASAVPTYLLAKHTRRFVTVALSGDGGDELFAGYPTFQAFEAANIYKKIPAFLRSNFTDKLLRLIPDSEKNFNLGFALKKFVGAMGDEAKYIHHNWLGSFRREERENLFRREVWDVIKNGNEFEEIDHYWNSITADEIKNKILGLYARTYLMDDVLVKTDRVSMKNSLEVRCPLLDRDFVELANSLPYSFKYKRFTQKYIFKKLMEEKLPKNIVYRKKKGFGMPLAGWLKNELKEFCEETLSENKIKSQNLFNYEYVEKLKREHFSGKRDNRKKIWTLMVFSLWHEKYMK